MFDAARRRIDELHSGGSPSALSRAAERIQERLRKDATTKRGNVPQFEPLGPNVSIAAVVRGADSIVVTAPAWVHKIARREGQDEIWLDFVVEEVRADLAKGGA